MPKLYFTKNGVEITTLVPMPFGEPEPFKKIYSYSSFCSNVTTLTTTSWKPIMDNNVLTGLEVEYIEKPISVFPNQIPIPPKDSMILPEIGKKIAEFKSRVYDKKYSLFATDNHFYVMRNDKILDNKYTKIPKNNIKKLIDYVNSQPEKCIRFNTKVKNLQNTMGVTTNGLWTLPYIAEALKLGETYIDEGNRLFFKLNSNANFSNAVTQIT